MPVEPLHLLLLFAVGALAGTINVMAGGGSTLTLPVLIFLGLDGASANGTNRVAIALQNVFAVLSFKGENVSNARQSLVFAACALPGSIVGALVAVRISDEWFQRILGIVMLLVVVSMLLPRRRKQTTPEGIKSLWIYPVLFAIGFYGGFIQVGVGFLFMAAFYHLLKMNLVHVNLHKVFVVLIYTLPVLIIFAASGNINWILGLSLAAGNSLGAWWAVKLAVRRGDKWVRIVMIIAILIMAAKILRLF
ncbi:MAG: sulfite exporter TauE/SafE family protein [Rhodothermales bacterium]|nr:sulfite exporter TauE/SafE family protein [Rhodothermales bacterium]